MYHNASHQGQWRTLALTQERFWWPIMAEDCYTIVRGCPFCPAFEGEVPRAPLCPIWAYAPLVLVHLDYTSIESTMELNKPPVVKNVLMMTDHFTRYALMVVIKDQTAKTVMKVFYEYFIAVFGVPAKLLSDSGKTSHPPWWKSCVLPSVFRSAGPQPTMLSVMDRWTLFCMIGKPACNKKAQWEQHLLELLQAYNSTQSVVTGYSPHYLMFGRCPHLPVDYYFLTVSAFECSLRVPAYVMEVRRCFKEAYAEAHPQTNCKAKKQKWYYD